MSKQCLGSGCWMVQKQAGHRAGDTEGCRGDRGWALRERTAVGGVARQHPMDLEALALGGLRGSGSPGGDGVIGQGLPGWGWGTRKILTRHSQRPSGSPQ